MIDFAVLLSTGSIAKQQRKEDTYPLSTRAGTWSSEHLTSSFNKHLFSADYLPGSRGSLHSNTNGRDHTWVSMSRANTSHASSRQSPKCARRQQLLLFQGNLPLRKVHAEWTGRAGREPWSQVHTCGWSCVIGKEMRLRGTGMDGS